MLPLPLLVFTISPQLPFFARLSIKPQLACTDIWTAFTRVYARASPAGRPASWTLSNATHLRDACSNADDNWMDRVVEG
ncbi:hypothetical protein BDQ12DRAFT_729772 [Crucibulum laeve]|uniref:Uncharacterized protein n=1 Tax=Crucibulum laeve TaxID=68775 RepID=A0A5C3LEW7_9AGAR|nr:hypothetical protein BDQ12DRAFT_729772 [Crucibulum laeve]